MSRQYTFVCLVLLALLFSVSACDVPLAPPVAEKTPANLSPSGGPTKPTPTSTGVEIPVASPTHPAAPSGIVIVIPEDPSAFNGAISDTGYNQMIMEMALLGMADIDPQGRVIPELAAEIPTLQNGGVTIDSTSGKMDVTWKMRPGVTWADGVPITANDVLFTWDAISNPDSGTWVEGADEVEGVEKLDDLTFVVHYKSIYPSYQLFLGGEDLAVFAQHSCDTQAGFTAWNCNQQPMSSGPYILKEWVVGDHLTFVRNPRYYQPGKPAIPQVVVKIVPDKEVEKRMLLQGEADVVVWVTESMIPDLEGQPDVAVSKSPVNRWSMRLFPNHALPGMTDAEANPHPILYDLKVRQAIRQAIDVDTIIQKVWHGLPTPVWTELFRPPYVCDIPRPKYDPEAARALLEAAGWKDTDGDGIRECIACAHAKPGTKLSFELTTYSEFGPEIEQTQALIGEMLAKVGMNAELGMIPGTVMWAEGQSGGTEQNGNFDLDLWDDGYPGIDPTDYLRYLYYSDSAGGENGWNIVRWKNPQFNALLDQAYTLDEAKRKDLFCQMATILDRELPVIPLFTILNADAYATRLQGVQSSVNDLVTWNIADWTLK